MKVTIDLDGDDETSIVKQSLQAYWENVDDTQDVIILTALEDVLKHYMLKEEFSTWLRTRQR